MMTIFIIDQHFSIGSNLFIYKKKKALFTQSKDPNSNNNKISIYKKILNLLPKDFLDPL